MTPTPHLPPEDADVAAVLRARADVGRRSSFQADFYALPKPFQDALYGIAAELENAADEIDRLTTRLQKAERERDALRAWKTATHEQWAAWTRDDFKARAEAAEAQEKMLREAAAEWVRAKDDRTPIIGENWHKRHDLNKAEAALRAALATADPEATE